MLQTCKKTIMEFVEGDILIINLEKSEYFYKIEIFIKEEMLPPVMLAEWIDNEYDTIFYKHIGIDQKDKHSYEVHEDYVEKLHTFKQFFKYIKGYNKIKYDTN